MGCLTLILGFVLLGANAPLGADDLHWLGVVVLLAGYIDARKRGAPDGQP